MLEKPTPQIDPPQPTSTEGTLSLPSAHRAEALFPLSAIFLSLLLNSSASQASHPAQQMAPKSIHETPEQLHTAETDSIATILGDQGVSVFSPYLFMDIAPPEDPFFVDGAIFYQVVDGIAMDTPGIFYRDYRNGPLTPGQISHMTSQGYEYETYYPSDSPLDFACGLFEDHFPGAVCDPSTSIAPQANQQPEYFETIRNYPNPFNGQTTLQFEIPEPKELNLNVFDIGGRKIVEQNLGLLHAGPHSIALTLPDLPSGIRFVQFEFGSGGQIEKHTHQILEVQ